MKLLEKISMKDVVVSLHSKTVVTLIYKHFGGIKVYESTFASAMDHKYYVFTRY